MFGAKTAVRSNGIGNGNIDDPRDALIFRFDRVYSWTKSESYRHVEIESLAHVGGYHAARPEAFDVSDHFHRDRFFTQIVRDLTNDASAEAMADEKEPVAARVDQIDNIANHVAIALNHQRQAAGKKLADMERNHMHQGIVVGDAIEFRLIVKIDDAVSWPQLGIEPGGVFPRPRIAAIDTDEDNFRLLDVPMSG